MAKTLGFIISFGSCFQTWTLDKLRRVRSGPDQHLCIAQNVTQSRNSLSSSLSWATKQHYVRVTYMSTVAGLHANISKACTSLHSLLSIKYLFNTIFKQSFCPFMNSPIFIQNVFCSFFYPVLQGDVWPFKRHTHSEQNSTHVVWPHVCGHQAFTAHPTQLGYESWWPSFIWPPALGISLRKGADNCIVLKKHTVSHTWMWHQRAQALQPALSFLCIP